MDTQLSKIDTGLRIVIRRNGTEVLALHLTLLEEGKVQAVFEPLSGKKFHCTPDTVNLYSGRSWQYNLPLPFSEADYTGIVTEAFEFEGHPFELRWYYHLKWLETGTSQKHNVAFVLRCRRTTVAIAKTGSVSNSPP